VDTAVTWEVNGIVAGNPTLGTISASGLYIAPRAIPNPSTIRVIVVSKADPKVSSKTLVTVVSCATVPKGLVGWWPGENNGQDVLATTEERYSVGSAGKNS
jgi:hypothetical protein